MKPTCWTNKFGMLPKIEKLCDTSKVKEFIDSGQFKIGVVVYEAKSKNVDYWKPY